MTVRALPATEATSATSYWLTRFAVLRDFACKPGQISRSRAGPRSVFRNGSGRMGNGPGE